VASYGQIADLAGMPGRARLVGKVLAGKHANALPWYRVIRSSGQIAFPAYSETASMQSERLESEGIAVVKNRVKMSDYQWQPNLPELLMQLEH
jgi:methylated-DNA-protein-cysteine methyltransferase-like protein